MYTEPTDISTLIAAIKARLFAFLAVFFVVFVVAYIFLSAFGLVPATTTVVNARNDGQELVDARASEDGAAQDLTPAETIEATDESSRVVVSDTSSSGAVSAEAPISITIDALDRTIPVNNPTSRTIADLDAALLTGVVRHPDSALPGQNGTVFILGHSSYLPQVNNKFFQAFNGVQNLAWGDTIRLTSENTVYVYQVDNVYKASASEVSVPIANTGPRLTIATCNSFGSKDDRHIVEAKLLYTEPRNG